MTVTVNSQGFLRGLGMNSGPTVAPTVSAPANSFILVAFADVYASSASFAMSTWSGLTFSPGSFNAQSLIRGGFHYTYCPSARSATMDYVSPSATYAYAYYWVLDGVSIDPAYATNGPFGDVDFTPSVAGSSITFGSINATATGSQFFSNAPVRRANSSIVLTDSVATVSGPDSGATGIRLAGAVGMKPTANTIGQAAYTATATRTASGSGPDIWAGVIVEVMPQVGPYPSTFIGWGSPM